MNAFAVTDKKGGKPLSLQGTPGLKQFCRWGATTQENFTTYTETDDGNKLTVAAATITAASLATSDDAVVYKDFTAAYFAANFEHEFQFQVTSVASAVTYPIFAVWVMSNRNGESLLEHDLGEYDYLAVLIQPNSSTSFYIRLAERNGAAWQSDVSSSYTEGTTTYYCSVIRDESVGTNGTLTLNIYTDSARTILLETLTLNLTEKANFQYLYAFQGYDSAAAGNLISATVSNLLISTVTTSYVPVRGLSNKIGNYIYAAIGSDIVRIDSAGAMTDKGNLDTATGPVYFCDDGDANLMFVDGTSGYSIKSDTFAKITDAQFPATPCDCTYQDGYFIAAKAGTDTFYRSAIGDPDAWDGSYDSAEGLNDDLLRIRSAGKDFMALGEQSYEWWYNSGTPFDRIAGSRRMIGCGAAASLGWVEGTFFWFTDKRRAVMSVGYDVVYISTPQIEYNWANYATVSDAVGFARVHEGHTFYTLTFPTQDVTWEYDATEDLWHELESQEGSRWRANCHTYAFNKHLVGDFELSTIYEADTDTYTDNGLAVTRIGDSGDIEAQGKMIFVHGLELIGETGVGNASAPSNDPQIYLSWSKDGGRTYNTPRAVDWGATTLYSTRAYFPRLGASKTWRFRVTYEEQTKFVLTGARFVPEPTIGGYA